MLQIIQIAIIAAVLPGILSLIIKRRPTIAKFSSFTLLGISGVAAAIAGILAVISQTNVIFKFSTGFPEIYWQLKLDPLSGFFLFIVGAIVLCAAIYSPAYMRSYEKHQQRSIVRMTFFTGLFIAGMYLVLLANDIFSFVCSWELMSLASYFLVAYHHEHAANRSAAFLYLLMAHISGLLLLLCYGILAKFSTDYSFSAMHLSHLPPFWANVAFILGLLGFGMKAGVVPLHIWLPRAHPVAPSHISALMSGAMLKVAVYGLLRLCFYLLEKVYWQWGFLILFIGVISALLGILYALMQHDLKKLLAYSSVENIGIIFIAIGLAVIFLSTGHPILAALGLIAALYQCLNHALFKSLLFFGAGAILQNSHEHDLEKMGGLIHKMPYVGYCFLIGCISISALPPLNGFISEWLTFQTALQASVLTGTTLKIIIPIAAAVLALTGALAATCFVKVFGIAFLGQPRSRHVRRACDAALGMRIAMSISVVLCILLGIFPAFIIKVINCIPLYLFGGKLLATKSWLLFSPISLQAASYSPCLILLCLLVAFALCYLIFNFHSHKKIIINKPWDCGFGSLNSRMQCSATAFAMPLRRVFEGAWKITESIDKTNCLGISYKLHIEDWIWKFLYLPLVQFTGHISRFFALIQGGNVRFYLLYMYVTLILLLWIIT
jgi:hydrogenase-4 component B